MSQLINQNKDLLKIKNNKEFWKIFRENFLKNSNNKIGTYLENTFKNLDLSEENIYKIYSLCEGFSKILSPSYFSKIDEFAGLCFICIKEALDYIGVKINGVHKKSSPITVRKVLTYCILKRKEQDQKLDKMIAKFQ